MVDKRYLKGIKLVREIRMPLPTTEKQSEHEPIDTLSAQDAAAFMLRGQHLAIDAVSRVAHEIDKGAQAMAAAIRSDNAIIYSAAGSSGLMAFADACELHGTFGIPQAKIQIHMAGGVPADGRMPGGTEDDTQAGEAIAGSIKNGDVVIVLSASGTTPYAVAVAKFAKKQGATVIAIANNPATDLLALADIAICLETPPEVIAGSTRLGAGTAQKAALNLMSSLMGIRLGHVHQGLMVNVVAENAKLMQRSVGIVAQVADVTEAAAQLALEQTAEQTKPAILVAAGCTPGAAMELLVAYDGHLGRCLQSLKSNQDMNV